MNRRVTVLVFSTLVIMILLQGIPVDAHTPQASSISYDFVDQELSVTFSHSVTDVNTHYIYQVVVEINSIEVLTRDYTSQNTTSSMSAVYSLVAVSGDYIEVTAKCIISGQFTQELDLTPINPNSTDTGIPLDPTIIIGIAIAVIGAIAVVIMLVKRR